MPRITRTGVQIYVDFPEQISPMLIAGSGKAKKSTAINLAKQFMKDAGVRIFDGKITPERLLAKLATLPGGQAIMTVVASELSAFMGKQSYNDGLIDTLIKLADCESHPYETQKATYDLSSANVCFTLVSGSTPTGLAKAIPPQAQEHGFLSRYIWVFSDKSGKIETLANDEDTVDAALLSSSLAQRRSLVVRLRAFSGLNGRFRWGTARDWFEDYYKDYAQSTASEGEGWPTRRADHLIRLAMVLNVARGNTDLTLTEQDVLDAHMALLEVEKNMNKCFTFIGQHVNADKQERILKILRPIGQIVKGGDLYYKVIKFFANQQELVSQLSLMEQAGIIGCVGKDPKTNQPLWIMLKEPY